MPSDSDLSRVVDAEPPVPGDLLHRQEDLDQTARALAEWAAALQPFAENLVYNALRRQTLEAGVAGLTSEAKVVLESLLSDSGALFELDDDEQLVVALRRELHAALAEGNDFAGRGEHDVLEEQMVLRGRDVARMTAGALLESLSGPYDVEGIDRHHWQAIADRGGFDGGQMNQYLNFVRSVLRRARDGVKVNAAEHAAAMHFRVHDR